MIGQKLAKSSLFLFSKCQDAPSRHLCADILVYEFMVNGSLDDHLYPPKAGALSGPDGSQTRFLDWPTRMKIALGAAKGLAFLHEVRSFVCWKQSPFWASFNDSQNFGPVEFSVLQ